MTLLSWLPEYQNLVNESISRYFANRWLISTESVESEFVEAIRHAVEWGGKRLRPVLAILAYEEITGQKCPENIIDGLIGIEFMHCYTLVHDDLPCMDNDILRRGKPTVWKAYGETMAVLVGDSLQTMAYERLSILGNIDTIRELSHALGSEWVVLWQVRDTLASQENYTIDDIMRLHDEKTGGFIASALVIGAHLGGGTTGQIDELRKFWMLLGRAFQVRDDILDIEGEITDTGKSIWKDLDQKKWLVYLYGLDATKKILEDISEDLDHVLLSWKNQKFNEVKEYVVTRKS